MPRSKVTLPEKWAYDLRVIEGYLLMESSSSFTSWDLMFCDAFFQNHCGETIPGKFRMIKTNDLFFLAVLLFYLILFFGIMICVPLGLYFRLPPKKSKKVPFEKKYHVDPKRLPVPVQKKKPPCEAAAASPKASTKKKSGGTPKALVFPWVTNLGWIVRMEDHR